MVKKGFYLFFLLLIAGSVCARPLDCPGGDLNDDCIENMQDLVLFAGDWLSVYDLVDFAAFRNDWLEGMGPLVISEFSASNSQVLVDEDGDSSDWIEVYNPTTSQVTLDGWKLVDGANQWTFPNGITIGADQYKVIFASGKDRTTDPSYLHTNFKLDSNGEYLGLIKDDGVTVTHSFDPNYPDQRNDISYGLYEGQARYLTTPTPGADNISNAYIGLVKDTKFSVKRGFYDASFDVEITCNTPGAAIYYTTDGSEPNVDDREYASPLNIIKTKVLRAKAFKDGWLPTNVDTQSYIFNASAVVKSLPVISIVGDAQQALYEPNGVMAIVGGYYDGGGFWQVLNAGDYNNPIQRGIEYEREVSVELMNSSGTPGFNINCGIRVQGSDWHRPHYTRGDDWTGWTYNKFSFKLFFRSEYGDSKLDYQMFPSTQHDVYDRLVLRGGHNDPVNPFIKDELIRRLQKDMSGFSSSGSFANLFLNGEYKGYYNTTEYLDEEFMQLWFNSDLEWDVITQRAPRDGDSIAWNEMLSFFESNDLSIEANYIAAGGWVDIEQFVDYLILQIYSSNWDWPANNWTVARERSATGKFRFFVWDAEASMGSLDQTAFDDYPSWTSPTGLNNLYTWDPISKILYALRGNADFRQLFADRVQRAFYNSGPLTNENLLSQFYQLRDEVVGILPGIDMYIPNTFIPGRRTPILDKFVAEGLYYYTTPAPVLNINGSYQHGGSIDPGDQFTITKTSPGTIYYTLNGTDPRLYGGGINPAAVAYDSSVTQPTLVAEGSTWHFLDDGSNQGTAWKEYAFDHETLWSKSGPAILGYGDNGEVTTISYGPDINNKYITTYLRHKFSVSDASKITGLTLDVVRDDGVVVYLNGNEYGRSNMPTGAVNYLTTASLAVAGTDEQAFFEVTKDPAAVSWLVNGDNTLAVELHQIGGTSSDTSFDLRLNAAESVGAITLNDHTNVKARVYNLAGQWSPLIEADYTVELGLVINEFMASNVATIEDPNEPGEFPDWIELYNNTASTIDLSGMYLTDDLANPTKWRIAPVTTIDPGKHILFWADDDGTQGKFHTNFKLSMSGEEIGLYDTNGISLLDSIVFGSQADDESYGRYPDGTITWGTGSVPTPNASNVP